MSFSKQTQIVEKLEVTSWGDGDFEIELDEGDRAMRVYLNLAEATDLADALNTHINHFEGEDNA
jgi:hypothetical protein